MTTSLIVRTRRGSRRRPTRPSTAPRGALFGFTLLEVMVAVAILGITLVSIFSSEAGAIRMAGRARMLTTASLLARCKMGELEEEVLNTGLPAVSSTGTDECCEDGEIEGFECEWEISRVVLPDAPTSTDGEEDEDSGLLGGLLGGGGSTPPPAAPMAPPAPPSPSELMSGSMLAGGGGGDMITQMAMQFVFPMIKPSIEDQVRRARVTVRWGEGDSRQEFDVVQYLVAEQLNAAQMQAASGGTVTPAGTTPTGQTGQQTTGQQ